MPQSIHEVKKWLLPMYKIINMVEVNTAWYHDRDIIKISVIQHFC